MSLPSAAASGVLCMLEEDDAALKSFALRKLDAIVDESWSEAASKASMIEELSEDKAFADHKLAARVASKIFYHLEAYPEALHLALESAELFDINERSEYSEKMIGQCIDEYTRARNEAAKNPDHGGPDPRMEAIVMRMFERCFTDGAWSQAVGIAVEARRLDVVEDAVSRAGRSTRAAKAILADAYDAALRFVSTREYRTSVFELLRTLHQEQSPVDYMGLMRCLEGLGDTKTTARLLVDLLKAGEDGSGAAAASSPASSAVVSSRTEEKHLMALQIAFDLAEADDQRFLAGVASALPNAPDTPEGRAAAAAAAATAAASGTGADFGGLPAPESGFWQRLMEVRQVLRRETTLRLQIHFLFKACKADRGILKRLKAAQSKARFDPVAHHALIVSAALMHAGTTLDFFYRDNIQWIRQATNWARFSAIASVGVYHKGNVENAMRVLDPMLPKPDAPPQSPEVAGGSLYALGLIHANRGAIEGDTTLPFLLEHLHYPDEIIQHGACLGLGLAAMGSCNELVFQQMHSALDHESAVAQEAAGLGIGLVLVGNGPTFTGVGSDGMQAVMSLLTKAATSPHEKTVRGATMGVALSCYGLEETADVVIEQMARDKDPIVRYSAQFARGLAFCGSAASSAVRSLLHSAVSDVSDDVRRAAVMALGFVLHRKPRELPKLVGLLAESFNPHVRYGAAMSLGIAAAATGMPSALHILQPLLDDPVDFVRQGAFMATAMVLQQESEARTPMVKKFRERVMADASNPFKPAMARMGAIMAAGILDAGGRNCVVSLTTPSGFTKPTAVIGMALFTQYWYWFPLAHCLSLATHPTSVVAVVPVKDKPGEFRLPSSFALDCRCRPGLFAYPDMLTEKTDDKSKQVTKVELSTASRTKARSRQRQLMRLRSQRSDGSRLSRSQSRALGGAASSTPGAAAGAASPSPAAASSSGAAAASAAGAAGAGSAAAASEAASAASAGPEDKPKQEAAAKEASRFQVPNASRVAPPQRKFLALVEGQRWAPVRRDVTAHAGVLVVRDTARLSGSGLADATDGDLEEIKRPRVGEDAQEPEPPAPFVFEVPGDEWDSAQASAEGGASATKRA
ncbi:hypothetical protein FNF31_03952 [Cafeteria roenbergensis]|nr:hypothetical protein FNF31_03952 [Cafeteria roenbergensis]KAA0170875.1 hypothetical protein FNF28_01148 [Cafeteria roenbergensis]